MPKNLLTPSAGEIPQAPVRRSLGHIVLRLVYWAFGLALAGALSLAIVIAVALAIAYPNLPDITELSDYSPILPLRIFSIMQAGPINWIMHFQERRRVQSV